MRWPRFLTRSAVSARSSGVDGGIAASCPGLIGAQMSTAMMSAPSCANRTAWARPWPRAAPVMNATLPSTLPAITPRFCCCSACLVDMSGHRIPAAHRGGVGLHRAGPVDLPLREAGEDLLERDATLQPGQRVAHAEMRSRTEGHVRAGFPVDVELVAVGAEPAVIPVGGTH